MLETMKKMYEGLLILAGPLRPSGFELFIGDSPPENRSASEKPPMMGISRTLQSALLSIGIQFRMSGFVQKRFGLRKIICSDSAMCEIGAEKYELHLPLHRNLRILASKSRLRSQFPIATLETMTAQYDWMRSVEQWHLRPLSFTEE